MKQSRKLSIDFNLEKPPLGGGDTPSDNLLEEARIARASGTRPAIPLVQSLIYLALIIAVALAAMLVWLFS